MTDPVQMCGCGTVRGHQAASFWEKGALGSLRKLNWLEYPTESGQARHQAQAYTTKRALKLNPGAGIKVDHDGRLGRWLLASWTFSHEWVPVSEAPPHALDIGDLETTG